MSQFKKITLTICLLTSIFRVSGNSDNDLLWEHKDFNFGKVTNIELLEHTFRFSNVSQSNIIFDTILCSCPYVHAFVTPDTLLPGHRGKVFVTLINSTIPEEVSCSLNLSADIGSIPLSIQADVEHILKISPPIINAGKVNRGDTVTIVTVFEWHKIKKDQLQCTAAGQHVQGVKIDQIGDKYALSISLSPQTETGTFYDTINISTGIPSYPFHFIPVYGEVVKYLSISPDVMNFRKIKQNTRHFNSVNLERKRTKGYTITKLSSSLNFIIPSITRYKKKDWTINGTIYPGAPLGNFSGTIFLYIDNKEKPDIQVPVKGRIIP